jgi:hypothetical protein
MKLPQGPKPAAAETADYIRVMSAELRGLAARADLPFLAYLLAMVEDDAQATARRLAGNRSAER